VSGGNGGDRAWVKWVAGIGASVLGGLVLFVLTHEGGPLNPKPSKEAPPMSGDITDVQLGTPDPCCTFSVQVKLAGFNGRTCPVRWTLVNLDTGEEQSSAEELRFTPEANVDQARADAGVQVPTSGNYLVRFVLLDPDGVELDRADSESFFVP